MKSKLMKQINQAEHFVVIGPRKFNYKLISRARFAPRTLLLYIDGGLNHRAQLEKNKLIKNIPFLGVGDNDSTHFSCDIVKKEQDSSDLCFALNLIRRHAALVKSVEFFGFIEGKRVDHFLFNLGEIDQFCRELPQKKGTKIHIESKLHFFPAGSHELSVQGLFSIITLASGQINLAGACAYPFEGKLPPLSSQGLSNIGHGKISIRSKKRFIIFQE